MLINFIDWFIKPLGWKCVPKEAFCIMLSGRSMPPLDGALADKIAHVIITHKPEYKDNVVRLDERV